MMRSNRSQKPHNKKPSAVIPAKAGIPFILHRLKKIPKQVGNDKKYGGLPTVLAILSTIIFSLAGILVSLNRFWQYDVFYYDFGIFDSAIWRVAHFQAPLIEHFVHGGKWIFADHFNPTIFLLSPLYWLTERSEVLLIAQAVLLGISGYILYRIAQKITNHDWFSLAITLCFFLFTGLQNAVISDFHEVALTVPFFLLTFYAFIHNKRTLYLLLFFLLLGCKESNFLLGIGIGITLFFLDKRQWRQSLATILISLLYGILAIKFIIPHFAGSDYQYAVPISLSPKIITSLFDNPQKVKTLFYSFASFGFLPFFSPTFYILLLEDFITRFYPPYLTLSWTLALHYSAVTAAILGLSSVFAFSSLKRLLRLPFLVSLYTLYLILTAIFLYRFILHGPFALAYNRAFYTHTKDFSFLNTLVSKVPKDVTVMTQNNLAVRFSHQQVYLLRDTCRDCKDYFLYYRTILPDYIVIDARTGQNPNDYYGNRDLQPVVTALRKDTQYRMTYHQADQYIFKRQ